ncbi:MAG: DUF3108 domain-containing protein [Pyrinomonadaceae bacterium]
MKSFYFPLLIFALCLASLCGSAGAQTDAKTRSRGRPFGFGETLTYNGKVSKIIQGISVASLTFTIGKATDSYDLVVTARARSKGTLIKLSGYSFVETYTSTIDADSFKALKSVHHDMQKDRVRDSEADFDYRENRVTYVETDPKDPMRPPRKIASSLTGPTHDLISGLYSLRLLPMEVGKSFDLTVSDSGLVYNIPVKITGREQQKTIFGKIWCWRVEPEVFGPGRLIEKEGKMVVWIADDARRIPVRAQIDTIFKVDIKLKAASNLK